MLGTCACVACCSLTDHRSADGRESLAGQRVMIAPCIRIKASPAPTVQLHRFVMPATIPAPSQGKAAAYPTRTRPSGRARRPALPCLPDIAIYARGSCPLTGNGFLTLQTCARLNHRPALTCRTTAPTGMRTTLQTGSEDRRIGPKGRCPAV